MASRKLGTSSQTSLPLIRCPLFFMLTRAVLSLFGKLCIFQESFMVLHHIPAARKSQAFHSENGGAGLLKRYQRIKIDGSTLFFFASSRTFQCCRVHYHGNHGRVFFQHVSLRRRPLYSPSLFPRLLFLDQHNHVHKTFPG